MESGKFGLIGYPLGHSLSPVIHKAGFESLGIDATYELLPTEDLVTTLKELRTGGYAGFNVTIPYKLPVVMFVDRVDEHANLARAVNTVKIKADKTLVGYNTDIAGFKKALPPTFTGNALPCSSDFCQSTPAAPAAGAKRAAILGTGGAAHAAVTAFAEMGVKQVVFFTRSIPNSVEKMSFLRKTFPQIDFKVLSIESINDLSQYSILVNATPIGMLGKAANEMPVTMRALETMSEDAIVYDLIYNPHKTILIKEAKKLGLQTINGLDMLINQAAAAQEIWFGKTPDVQAMKIAALEELV